jgi:DNA-binding transcriptional ArsR family regulator
LTIAAALRDTPELCVCDLAWIVERAQNLVSHHLRALRAAGLVDYRRDGKMALYSLTGEGRAVLELLAVEDAARV